MANEHLSPKIRRIANVMDELMAYIHALPPDAARHAWMQLAIDLAYECTPAAAERARDEFLAREARDRRRNTAIAETAIGEK